MKTYKRYLPLLLIFIMILSFVSACGSKQNHMSEYGTNDDSDTSIDLSSSLNTAPESGESEENNNNAEYLNRNDESPLEPEKVITTIDIHLETVKFIKTNKELTNIIKKHKAYIEDSNIGYVSHYNNRSYRNAFYTIRIPKNNVDNFKLDLDGIGNMISENISKEDVSKQYKDIESRLKIVEVKEERILVLLTKADKIEDIIKLEEQLSKTIYEKEKLKSNLMDMDDKVDFTTMIIHIDEVDKLTSQNTINTSFKTKFINTIKDSIFFFKKTLQQLILLLIYVLPFALIIGITVYIIIRIIRKFKNINN